MTLSAHPTVSGTTYMAVSGHPAASLAGSQILKPAAMRSTPVSPSALYQRSGERDDRVCRRCPRDVAHGR